MFATGSYDLAPALPVHWQTLSFPLRWQGSAIQITINAAEIRITSTEQIVLWVNGEKVIVQGETVISNATIISPNYGTATTKGGDE
jgi:Glycosyl hydrolase family 65, C-terminal domain.